MDSRTFSHWFYSYQQQALMLNERRLVVLVGSETWASSLLKTVDFASVENAKQGKSTWFVYGESDHVKANVAKQRFRDKLGSESDFVVFNGINLNSTELSIDAFAALSGTLVAGGVFFLLINDMVQVVNSLFYKRFFNLIESFPEHMIVEQDVEQASLTIAELANDHTCHFIDKTNTSLAYGCATQEQLSAVEAVIKVLKGKRNKPLVLTADRGRGKSSAMAIACGRLLKGATKENKLRLVVTAADFNSLTIFFNQLVVSLPEGEFHKTKFCIDNGSVEYIAIDQLLKKQVDASLVLVDEAAAIPIYLLEQLLLNHSRLVFASTIHGYEGAGRGFTLKFQQTLTEKFPQWQNLHINEPIRWRADDPLEQLVFDACLLNAELPDICTEEQEITQSNLMIKQFSAAELVTNEQLFKQIFAVLVTAHYQTKPSDVQMLLDNKQVQLVCLLSDIGIERQVVAVALLINEGKFDGNNIEVQEIKAINQSKRRLKNHFVPQSLLTQCGIEQAFNYHFVRVMRIAVHPQLQQQGIGSYFLDEIAELAKRQGADFLASSFGATKPLLSFWLNSNFQIARIGFNKDKASGEQSAMVLKALSKKLESTLADINTEFYRSFDYLLTDEYRHLAAELVMLIQHYYPTESLPSLSIRDKANIEAFSQGYRQFSSCVYSLHLWLKQQLSSSAALEDENLLVLISRIMQKQSITEVCSAYGFTGKKDLEQFLKSTIQRCLTV